MYDKIINFFCAAVDTGLESGCYRSTRGCNILVCVGKPNWLLGKNIKHGLGGTVYLQNYELFVITQRKHNVLTHFTL